MKTKNLLNLLSTTKIRRSTANIQIRYFAADNKKKTTGFTHLFDFKSVIRPKETYSLTNLEYSKFVKFRTFSSILHSSFKLDLGKSIIHNTLAKVYLLYVFTFAVVDTRVTDWLSLSAGSYKVPLYIHILLQKVATRVKLQNSEYGSVLGTCSNGTNYYNLFVQLATISYSDYLNVIIKGTPFSTLTTFENYKSFMAELHLLIGVKAELVKDEQSDSNTSNQSEEYHVVPDYSALTDAAYLHLIFSFFNTIDSIFNSRANMLCYYTINSFWDSTTHLNLARFRNSSAEFIYISSMYSLKSITQATVNEFVCIFVLFNPQLYQDQFGITQITNFTTSDCLFDCTIATREQSLQYLFGITRVKEPKVQNKNPDGVKNQGNQNVVADGQNPAVAQVSANTLANLSNLLNHLNIPIFIGFLQEMDQIYSNRSTINSVDGNDGPIFYYSKSGVNFVNAINSNNTRTLGELELPSTAFSL